MSHEKRARLGRGLDALLSGTPEGPAPTEVAVGAIDRNPHQPRKQFDDDELSSLCASIKAHGLLQPLVVRQVGGRFQLIAGERRLRAARSAGLAAVPVRVVDFDDQQVVEAALVENIQRSDLNPIEKAQGFKDYLDRFHMTHDQLAARIGLARSTITNLVALLDLAPEVQDAVRFGQLTTGHAKLLKGVTDRARQVSLCKEFIARALSVHAAEAFLKQGPNGPGNAAPGKDEPAGEKAAGPKTAHVQSIQDELRQKFGVKVEIRVRSRDAGQFVFPFESNDDFERLLEALRK
jgi:ParB family chromosome partitioning protein